MTIIKVVSQVKKVKFYHNMEIEKQENSVYPFTLITEKGFPKLLTLLKKRLPRSCHVHNMLLLQPKFSNRMKFYTFEGNLEDDAWIVVLFEREDVGVEINTSVPFEPKITSRIKDAFINSGLIDWYKPYRFSATDRSISRMIFEIGGYIKGNNIQFTPCSSYYANTTEALTTKIETPNEGEVRKLDLDSGAEFILKAWKHKKPGSKEYVECILRNNDSVGLYMKGKPVCGIVTFGNGRMGMLNTAEEHRHKGYAIICMKTLMKKLALNGLVPCSAVELSNIPSMELHKKLGMKFSHMVDFIGRME